MLVLSRKMRETIKIGDDIVITVVALAPDRVRIGITAPENVRVFRGELLTEKPLKEGKTRGLERPNAG